MKLKQLIYEDFINYKKACLFLAMPTCTFKCEKECGIKCCQNSDLAQATAVEIDTDKLISNYISNPITQAVVLGGLEPLDTFDELIEFVQKFREKTDDDIVIYTGYYKNEVLDKIEQLCKYKNVIVKFGRFIPNQTPHFDEVLGVKLASDNQYAEKIS
jgi:pyruvate-formate lyase-activating enzyme